MSDHSTQAMTPKEPPKTCGTCDHADPYALSCDICGKSRRFQVGYEEKACGYWVKGTDALEQRYKQLEQVAKELYKEAEACEIALKFTLGETPTEAERLASYAMLPYKDELEALGVSLDD